MNITDKSQTKLLSIHMLKRAQKAQPVSHANKLPDDDAFLRAARALNYNLYIAHADSNSEVSNEELADAIRAAMKGDE